jgi:hypothetical protein
MVESIEITSGNSDASPIIASMTLKKEPPGYGGTFQPVLHFTQCLSQLTPSPRHWDQVKY